MESSRRVGSFFGLELRVELQNVPRFLAMPSELDIAKRGLVKVLKDLAAKYHVNLTLSRESSNIDVTKAFRKLSLKTHPDKGGAEEDFKRLSSTNDTWQNLLKQSGNPGRPSKADEPERPKAGKPWTVHAPQEKKEFTVRSQAVLLTFQSFSEDLSELWPTWERFVSFAGGHVKEWGVKFWTATAETNEDGRHHFHLMLQFFKAEDKRLSSLYTFEGVLPNASANDLLGGAFGGKRFFHSVLHRFVPSLSASPACLPSAQPCASQPPVHTPKHSPPIPNQQLPTLACPRRARALRRSTEWKNEGSKRRLTVGSSTVGLARRGQWLTHVVTFVELVTVSPLGQGSWAATCREESRQLTSTRFLATGRGTCGKSTSWKLQCTKTTCTCAKTS